MEKPGFRNVDSHCGPSRLAASCSQDLKAVVTERIPRMKFTIRLECNIPFSFAVVFFFFLSRLYGCKKENKCQTPVPLNTPSLPLTWGTVGIYHRMQTWGTKPGKLPLFLFYRFPFIPSACGCSTRHDLQIKCLQRYMQLAWGERRQNLHTLCVDLCLLLMFLVSR